MNLRFIIGRAGSGKTYNCLDEIRQSLINSSTGSPLILLVPEQATFQMEYALTTTPDLGGLIRAQVLSFRRLAWKVLNETGGATRLPIGELGKRMVLRRILELHQDKLKIFYPSSKRPGFADLLARSIGEMKIYRVSAKDLASVTESLNKEKVLLKDKLADTSLIYMELEKYMSGRYTDPDDYLNLLAEKSIDSPTIKGAEVWIDGFTGFTPQEMAVLKNILKYAQTVNITLCLEPAKINQQIAEEDFFYPTWETYQDISRFAGQLGINFEEPLLMENEPPQRFINNPGIAHTEKYFFQYPTRHMNDKLIGIKLVGGANRRAEVEAAAREVLRLCRDQNYRWRDMALVMRDIDSYHELITTIFYDYKIPFFIDHKRTVLHHPLIELIRSALETIASGWAYEPIFRFLKTDLIPISREQVDLLENYVLTYGIRGSLWTDNKDWKYRRFYTLGEEDEINPDELEHLKNINEYRHQASSILVNFNRKTDLATNVKDLTGALYELIEELKVAEQLNSWSADEENSGNLEKAREHVQVWNQVINLLDEIVESLGDEELSLETYLNVLDTGFENMRLGLIPPGLDQLLIGSLDRSRNPDLKAILILGASEGVLPARSSIEGIFNDEERELLDISGITLAPGSRRRTFNEQYLIYTALTRASDFLYVSYPLADDEGRSIPPSPIIKRLKELFPNLKETVYQTEPTWGKGDDMDFINGPYRSLTYLSGNLREAKAGHPINKVWFEVYNWYVQKEKTNYMTARILKSIFHINQEKAINPKLSRQMYGLPVRASVSRIEKFKSCPFSHYANYGLRLRERTVHKLAAPDMGEFFHSALKDFVDELNNKAIDWSSLKVDECLHITDEVVDKLIPRLQNEILLSNARYRYMAQKLKKIINQATIVLSEHARRSEFKTVGVEMSFGPGGQLPAVKINLPEGNIMELVGRIDRIDLAEKDNKSYIRIIDYKSSDNQIELPDIYYGLKLQLLTYLHVALTNCERLQCQNGLPGGILYFTVKNPLIKASFPLNQEEITREINKELKMRGYLLANPELIRMMDKNLTTGWSDLLPAAINKGDVLHNKSKVISGEQFTILRQYLQKVLMEAGKEIVSGNVNIIPYRKKDITSCIYCNFKPLCQFDTLFAENKYRYLNSMSADRFWALITAGEGTDGKY